MDCKEALALVEGDAIRLGEWTPFLTSFMRQIGVYTDNSIKLGVVYEDHSMVLRAPPLEILPLFLVDSISVSSYQQHKLFTLLSNIYYYIIKDYLFNNNYLKIHKVVFN